MPACYVNVVNFNEKEAQYLVSYLQHKFLEHILATLKMFGSLTAI